MDFSDAPTFLQVHRFWLSNLYFSMRSTRCSGSGALEFSREIWWNRWLLNWVPAVRGWFACRMKLRALGRGVQKWMNLHQLVESSSNPEFFHIFSMLRSPVWLQTSISTFSFSWPSHFRDRSRTPKTSPARRGAAQSPTCRWLRRSFWMWWPHVHPRWNRWGFGMI